MTVRALASGAGEGSWLAYPDLPEAQHGAAAAAGLPRAVLGRACQGLAAPAMPAAGLRQRAGGSSGERAERAERPAPTAAAAGGGPAATRPERSRWPLLPGFWGDDPDADRKAWMACSFDRVLNA